MSYNIRSLYIRVDNKFAALLLSLKRAFSPAEAQPRAVSSKVHGIKGTIKAKKKQSEITYNTGESLVITVLDVGSNPAKDT